MSFDLSLFTNGYELHNVVSDTKHYQSFTCGKCQKLASLDCVVTSRCNHVFCRRCLEEAVALQAFTTTDKSCSCPVCQTDLSPPDGNINNCMPFASIQVAARPLQEAQPLAFQVLSLVQVKCIHGSTQGCEWKGDYGTFLPHVANHVVVKGTTKTAAAAPAITQQQPLQPSSQPNVIGEADKRPNAPPKQQQQQQQQQQAQQPQPQDMAGIRKGTKRADQQQQQQQQQQDSDADISKSGIPREITIASYHHPSTTDVDNADGTKKAFLTMPDDDVSSLHMDDDYLARNRSSKSLERVNSGSNNKEMVVAAAYVGDIISADGLSSTPKSSHAAKVVLDKAQQNFIPDGSTIPEGEENTMQLSLQHPTVLKSGDVSSGLLNHHASLLHASGENLGDIPSSMELQQYAAEQQQELDNHKLLKTGTTAETEAESTPENGGMNHNNNNNNNDDIDGVIELNPTQPSPPRWMNNNASIYTSPLSQKARVAVVPTTTTTGAGGGHRDAPPNQVERKSSKFLSPIKNPKDQVVVAAAAASNPIVLSPEPPEKEASAADFESRTNNDDNHNNNNNNHKMMMSIPYHQNDTKENSIHIFGGGGPEPFHLSPTPSNPAAAEEEEYDDEDDDGEDQSGQIEYDLEGPTFRSPNKKGGGGRKKDWNMSINSMGCWDDMEDETDLDQSAIFDDIAHFGNMEDDDDADEEEKHNRIIERAEKLKKQANAKFNKGKFKDARALYTEGINVMSAVSATSQDECKLLSNMHSNRAVTYFREKEYDECIEDCDKALMYEPTYDKSWIRKWRAYMAMGRFDDAYTCLETGAAKIPFSKKIITEFKKVKTDKQSLMDAEAFLEKGEITQCRDFLKKCLIGSENIALLNFAAKVDISLGNVEEALSKIDRALRVNPTQEDAVELKGVAHFILGDSEKAVDALYEAYNENKESKKIQAALSRFQKSHTSLLQARSAIKKNNFEAATELFTNAIKESSPLPPNSLMFALLRKERAQAYVYSLNYLQALKDCQEVMNVRPNYAPIWVVRSEVLVALGKAADAKKELSKAKKSWGADDPDIDDAYYAADFETRIINLNNDVMGMMKQMEAGTFELLDPCEHSLNSQSISGLDLHRPLHGHRGSMTRSPGGSRKNSNMNNNNRRSISHIESRTFGSENSFPRPSEEFKKKRDISRKKSNNSNSGDPNLNNGRSGDRNGERRRRDGDKDRRRREERREDGRRSRPSDEMNKSGSRRRLVSRPSEEINKSGRRIKRDSGKSENLRRNTVSSSEDGTHRSRRRI